MLLNIIPWMWMTGALKNTQVFSVRSVVNAILSTLGKSVCYYLLQFRITLNNYVGVVNKGTFADHNLI